MEIIQELEREFGLALIATAPSVRYRIETVQGETIEIDNPQAPAGGRHRHDVGALRPGVDLRAHRVHGRIYKLAQEARGEHRSVEHIKRVHLTFDFPLAEIIVDFYDRLKSSRAATRRSTTTSSSSGRPSWSSSTSS